MKVVNTGDTYRIYGDHLQTFDELPARAYQVNFHPQEGFYLSEYEDIVIEEKIYGVHMEKVDKVLDSYEKFERNLGIILSGEKGIGKSLFAKILSNKGIAAGYPLIVVNRYIPGIADFLASIQQKVVVLFDEFDKTFFNRGMDQNSMKDPQTEMLTLFDGLSQGKKLFVITCNELERLNDFLVNRPGRFHYHFRFDYPNAEEICTYLKDNIPEEMYSQIDGVVNFAQKINLNYDCLRAIAFELTNGNSFADAIKDLNILNLDLPAYVLNAFFTDGSQGKGIDRINLFANEEISAKLSDEAGYNFFVYFDPEDAIYDYGTNKYIVPGDKVKLGWQEPYYSSDKEMDKLKERQQRQIAHLEIKVKRQTRDLHYAI